MAFEFTLQNFAGGLLSERMNARYRLSIYQTGLSASLNGIIETQGSWDFRTGKNHITHTRLNQIADLERFEFNDEQAYQLEFTNKKLRFYRNEGQIVEDPFTITGITKANPAVVTTSASHLYTSGDEVSLADIVGMTELNGKNFLITVTGATTFSLQDIDGNNIDSTGFTAYSSGGESSRVYEIDTPYTEALNMFVIKKTQNADTMYLTHPFYEPRKLTRTGNTAWTLDRFVRIADPFLDEQVISNITQANPGVVTATGHTHLDGDVVIIEEVVGMVEVNSQPYIVANSTANTYELTDLDGNNVDTTGFTAYGSVGFSSNQNLLPAAVAFYESRLFYAGTGARPDGVFASMAPEGAGDPNPGLPRYEDHTLGTNADDAITFTIANAEVNKIFWLAGTDKVLLAGTFGTEIQITGSTIDAPITPTSIKARAINRIGVQDVAPVNKDNSILYVQRGGLTVKSLEFDALQRESYTPQDRNLVSDSITESGVKKLAWQTGRPDIAWAVLNNGKMASLTYNVKEDIFAWSEHNTGATGEDKWVTVSTMPRPSSFDQTWMVSEREIDGNTRRYVGFLGDKVIFPRRIDFFTTENTKDADDARFLRAMQEAQKGYNHHDSSLSYDGRDIGLAAGATMTPSAVTGNPITFTASAPVFASTDVGREIWKKTSTKGVGFGRARIVTVTDTQNVECNIIQDFDSTDVMAAGDWYLTASQLSNLDHLEGREIGITTDGSPHPKKTVTNGAITLNFQSSRFHVGLDYLGIMATMPLEIPGATGSGQTKNKHINFVGFRVLDTLGIEFGTDIYNSELVRFTRMPIQVGGPQPVITGLIPEEERISFDDDWSGDKIVFVRQRNSLPATIQMMAIYGETDDN